MSLLIRLALPALVTTSAGIGVGVAKKSGGIVHQNQVIEKTQLLSEKEVTPQLDQKEQAALVTSELEPSGNGYSDVEGPSMEATEIRDSRDISSVTSPDVEQHSMSDSPLEVVTREEDSRASEAITSHTSEHPSTSEPVIEMASGEKDLRVTEEEVPPITVPEAEVEEKGNCEVIDPKEELEGELPLEETYVSVTCSNAVDSESMLAKWTGFFPTSWFNVESQSKLSLGKKFDIEIKELDPANDEEDPFKTEFKSEKFVNKSMIGAWGNNDEEGVTYKEETIYEILLEDKESKFYLHFPQQ